MEDLEIQEFYNQWPYPALDIISIRKLAAIGYRDQSDPTVHWQRFFMNRNQNDSIKILIAGCGTIQAGLIAVRNPQHDITAIDISTNSISYQKTICENDNITNITFVNESILDFHCTKEFDLIICGGVLHHTSDPLKNLMKLKSLLSDQGVMSIMLYNEANRSGVYKIKNIIDYLNLSADETTARDIKNLIKSLDYDHSIKKYLKSNTELSTVNNFMDTFFNPREIAFNPVSVKKLLDSAGLKFLGWLTEDYDIEKLKKYPFFQEIKMLDPFKQAHIIDLIEEKSSKIEFFVKK